MKKKRSPWYARVIDFVVGFLLGTMFCIGGSARSGAAFPLKATLVVGLVCGGLFALFGRRVWRFLGMGQERSTPGPRFSLRRSRPHNR